MSDILNTDFDEPPELDDHRVSLGDDINVIEKDPALRVVHVGFGWDLTGFNSDVIDLDVSVFLLNKDGKTREDGDFAFYNNMEILNGAVKHNGDNRTGAGEGDDESMTIDLEGIPFDIVQLAFVISIYKGHEKSQNISMVHNAFIRIANSETNIELMRYDMDAQLQDRTETGMLVAFLNREGPKWHFVPQAEHIPGGLGEIATKYGMIIAQQ